MRRDFSSWLGTLGMTGRKATYRRSRANHTLKSRGAAHAISLAGGEPLDSRKMLAVTAQTVGDGLLISLDADSDIAGLVLNTNTSKYEVYDNTTLVDSFDASGVQTIQVIDSSTAGGEDQVFEVRDGGAIAASLGVSNEIETTKVFSDIDVTSKSTITGGYGIVLSSPTIILDDATPIDELLIATNKTTIEFGGVVTLIGGTDARIDTDTGAGDIDFLDDIIGEDGSGTLTFAAGTGVITFAGDVGGTGEDQALLGVAIESAKSVTVTGKTYLDGTSINSFVDGFTIGDGVNDVNLSNGGQITGFTNDGAGIWFEGKSTNSTVSGFELTGNTYGIYLGGGIAGEADLSGTVIDDNVIGEDQVGIYIDNVAGNLNGEDVLLIGGTAGNLIAANGEDGIYGWSSTGVEIRNNTIIANGLDGLGAGSGISLEGGGEYLITQNTIGEDGVGPVFGLGNSYDGITIDGEDGFYSYAGTEIRTNGIEYNAFYGVRVTGVTLDTGEDSILIFDNTIANNGFNLTKTAIGGIRIDGSENIRIINNEISFNGEDASNGIDIVNVSHGTAVFSNQIIQNSRHGIYVEDSSTDANPVQIGDVLPITDVTAFTVTTDGDARAAILPGQQIGLAYVVDPTNVATATLITRTVVSVSYDAVVDKTTITFSDVPGDPDPYALTLGNYILGNNTQGSPASGSGISVLATATATPIATVTATITVGTSPRGVAVSPDGNRVYASNYGGDTVSVIDAATGLVVATINVGDAPIGVAFTPDGFRAYVANEFGGSVSVIDTNPANTGTYNTVVATVSVGSNPNAVAFTPDGFRGYVSNGSAGTVSVIDTNPANTGTYNTVIATITVGGAAAAVAITPDGTRAYVPNDAGGAFVSVIDTDPTSVDYNTVLGSIRVGNAPVAVAVSPDGTRVYVTNKDDGTVSVINTENNLVIGTIAGFSAPVGVAFSPDSTLAYVTNKDNGTVSVVDTASSTVIGTITVGSAPGAVAVSSDGGSTYVTNEGGGTVSVIDNIAGVEGIEILGNVVLGSDADGIRLDGSRAARFGDLSGALIAGNFVGRDPVGEDSPNDFGNLGNGIRVLNGNGIAIQANYVAANGRDGIFIVGSLNVDIGEDGLGNYVARNVRNGVGYVYSQFVTVVDNEIADNGSDGVYVYSSEDVLIQGNSIHDNGRYGINAYASDRVEITDNLVEGNLDSGIRFERSTDALVIFNIVAGNDGDGVAFSITKGTIEGNEIYENGEDGVYVNGGDAFNGIVDVLGNIIRENGGDGLEIRDGYFGYDLFDVDVDGRLFSVVGGNTIERNGEDGVAFVNVGGVQVGGRFPSDINFINLNGSAGVHVSGAQPINTPFVAGGVRVLGNEIDSNEQYGIWLDSVRSVIVGGGNGDYNEWDVYAGPEAANTIRRNGIAGIFAEGYFQYSEVINNDISENPIGVMLTSAYGLLGNGLAIGGPSLPDFPAEDSEIGDLGNRIFDNGEGIRATGDCYGTVVEGNLIEDNLTGATLASVRGLTFGYGEDESTRIPVPIVNYGNTVRNNNEGLRGSGDLTDTVVAGNQFLDNTKVGIALQSAKNLTVGGFGEDSPNVISGSPVGLSASGTMTGTEVLYNQFSENVIGIALSKATGMTVGGNTIDKSAKYGISITGNNAGTTISGSIVTNTAGLPGYEHGIYLDGGRNVDVLGNTVSDSKGAGIYVTGNTSGTAVENNFLDGNRFGIALVDATNAVIGGLGEDEGNTIVGGGDSAAGDYRDGIYASGTLTGSSITGTVITNASTGVLLESAQGLVVTDTTVNDSQRYGFFARGDNAGTSFTNSTIDGTGGVPSTEHGMMLLGAKNLSIEGNTISNGLGAGLYLGGDNAGTTVYDNDFDGNRFGIAFVNATNTVIGGDTPGEDNRIVGGGDPLLGEYRDGIYAAGVNTGSSITQTKIESCWTGINLESATGLTVRDAEVLKATGYGIYAKGTNTGTLLDDINVEQDPASIVSNGSILEGAEGLTIDNSTFTGDGTAIYVIGGASGTIIEDSTITGVSTGLNVLGAVGLTVRRNAISGSTNGLIVSNACTGTWFRANTISASASGAAAASFYSVTGASFFENSSVTTGGNGFGFYATGNNADTVVYGNVFNNNTVGVYLNAAANIVLGTLGSPEDGNTISNSSFAGLQAAGACTNSFVYDTTWTSNAKNVDSTATGLTINPPAP